MGSKSLSYGALADAASKEAVPEKVTLKDPAQFRYLGKPQPAARRADESGRQREIRPRHAPARHAVRRGRAAAGDRREVAEGRRQGGARRYPAWSTSRSCRPAWRSTPPTPGPPSAAARRWPSTGTRGLTRILHRRLRAEYQRLVKQPGAVARETGDVRSGAGRRRASTWTSNTSCPTSRTRRWSRSTAWPTCAPMAAICISARRCSRPTAMRWPQALGMDASKVQVHTAFLGGGFGRRAQRYSEVAVEAAHASRAVGKPVQVVWTREDDVQGLSYRPFVCRGCAPASTRRAMPVAWQQCIVSQGVLRGGRFESFIPKGRSSIPRASKAPRTCPTRIPNMLVDTHEGNPHGARPVVALGRTFAHRRSR